MHVSKRLLEWRLGKDMSQREASAAAGLTQPAWQAYEAAKARPKQHAADAIERLTEGAIRASEWAETEEERAVRRARAKARTPRTRKAAASRAA